MKLLEVSLERGNVFTAKQYMSQHVSFHSGDADLLDAASEHLLSAAEPPVRMVITTVIPLTTPMALSHVPHSAEIGRIAVITGLRRITAAEVGSRTSERHQHHHRENVAAAHAASTYLTHWLRDFAGWQKLARTEPRPREHFILSLESHSERHCRVAGPHDQVFIVLTEQYYVLACWHIKCSALPSPVYFTLKYTSIPGCRFRRARIAIGGRGQAATAGLNAATDDIPFVVLGALSIAVPWLNASYQLFPQSSGSGGVGMLHRKENTYDWEAKRAPTCVSVYTKGLRGIDSLLPGCMSFALTKKSRN